MASELTRSEELVTYRTMDAFDGSAPLTDLSGE
jgi:hypothetical protein